MARFREAPPDQAPDRLVRFCWAEWPDIPPEEAIRRWHTARLAWHEDHAVITADRVRESVLGSWVDLWRAKRAAHMRWDGAAGVRMNMVIPCTREQCNGGSRCALRREQGPEVP